VELAVVTCAVATGEVSAELFSVWPSSIKSVSNGPRFRVLCQSTIASERGSLFSEIYI